MLAERVKEWTPLTRPDAFEPIAEWVIDARDAEDFLSRLRTLAETLEIARDVARRLLEAQAERNEAPELPEPSGSLDVQLVVGG